ncbi:cilia- and flagella-associated protein 251-like [Ornithorhynchus anatinus]|uniref:cilia- and flagella-associated protein 251-like n=1 Tax=Ornithorhynchus anatinus TaxID=9258 RepID=UPI0010A78672|nr:cilia- and flagella-associated protein 251-like [Ornithorhynchus anatinus]
MKIFMTPRHFCCVIFGDSALSLEHCCSKRCCCKGRIYCHQLFGSPDLWEDHRMLDEAKAILREALQGPIERDEQNFVAQTLQDELSRQEEGQKMQEKLWAVNEGAQIKELDPLEEVALELERVREMYWEEKGKQDHQETEQTPEEWQIEEKGTQTEEVELEWAEEMDSEANGKLDQQETEETPEESWSKKKGTQTEDTMDPMGLEEVDVEGAEELRPERVHGVVKLEPREKPEESAVEQDGLRCRGDPLCAESGLWKLPTPLWFPGGSHCCDWICSSFGWNSPPVNVLGLATGAYGEGGQEKSSLQKVPQCPPERDQHSSVAQSLEAHLYHKEIGQQTQKELWAKEKGTQTDELDLREQEVLGLQWVPEMSRGANSHRDHREIEQTSEEPQTTEKGTQTEELDPIEQEAMDVAGAEELRLEKVQGQGLETKNEQEETKEEELVEQQSQRGHRDDLWARPVLQKHPTPPWFPSGGHCCDWMCCSLGWGFCLRLPLMVYVLGLAGGGPTVGLG